MQDNRRPQVASVTVNTGQTPKPPMGGGGPDEGGGEEQSEGPPPPMAMPQMAKPKVFRFMWKASDPNGDALRYDLFLRRAGTPYWIELEKDLTQPMQPWDPRSAPDGEYVIKVVASDTLANPAGMGLAEARISDPFTVDNTAPVVMNLACSIEATGKVRIRADLVDEISEIASAHVAINAAKEWQYVAPGDELYDNKTEHLDTAVPVKNPTATGPVMVTIKVTDREGNTGYAWTLVPQTTTKP